MVGVRPRRPGDRRTSWSSRRTRPGRREPASGASSKPGCRPSAGSAASRTGTARSFLCRRSPPPWSGHGAPSRPFITDRPQELAELRSADFPSLSLAKSSKPSAVSPIDSPDRASWVIPFRREVEGNGERRHSAGHGRSCRCGVPLQRRQQTPGTARRSRSGGVETCPYARHAPYEGGAERRTQPVPGVHHRMGGRLVCAAMSRTSRPSSCWG